MHGSRSQLKQTNISIGQKIHALQFLPRLIMRALVLITRLSSLDSARLACKANNPMAGWFRVPKKQKSSHDTTDWTCDGSCVVCSAEHLQDEDRPKITHELDRAVACKLGPRDQHSKPVNGCISSSQLCVSALTDPSHMNASVSLPEHFRIQHMDLYFCSDDSTPSQPLFR